tara:strand:- start:261 stop:911 length:651 start_codon:yes stop_codon:yes gene_type:complete
MTIADWLMIVVVLLAPLIAVQVQKWLESWNEKSERKRKIFETLMTTRATRLDPAHVAALNMIDFVFDKDKSINEKWREYLDCLCEVPQTPSIQATENEIRYAQQSMEKWSDKNDEKFIDLLYEMSKVLKYEFDKVHLKKGIYYPQAHSVREMEEQSLRRAAVSFFNGSHAVNMNVTSFPDSDDEITDMQAKIRGYILDLMNNKKSVPISMKTSKDE